MEYLRGIPNEDLKFNPEEKSESFLETLDMMNGLFEDVAYFLSSEFIEEHNSEPPVLWLEKNRLEEYRQFLAKYIKGWEK